MTNLIVVIDFLLILFSYGIYLTDTLGLMRVIGNTHFGLMLDYDSMVDADMGGQRGTAFTLAGELPVPSARVG